MFITYRLPANIRDVLFNIVCVCVYIYIYIYIYNLWFFFLNSALDDGKLVNKLVIA